MTARVSGSAERADGPIRAKRFTAAEAAAVGGGAVVTGPSEALITGAASDSRRVRPGDLFVAIPGERVDGHTFLGAAAAAGAAAALVSRAVEAPPGLAVIQVDDTVAALGRLATDYRRRFDLPVVGVTGSVGKTTTKDLLAGVLGRSFETLANEGNLNTEVGLPLTVLELERRHQVGVFEMGMRGRGEITYLAGIARPSIGLITNIGPTHLELLGSIENIARAKAELIEALPADGLAVLNGDDPLCRSVSGLTQARVVYYGAGPDGEVRAEEFETLGEKGVRVLIAVSDLAGTGAGPTERFEVVVPIPGRHNVGNALAAVAVGRALGMSLTDIAAGLAAPRRSAMRLAVVHAAGLTIIDDTYNAGPASMRAALGILMEVAGGGRSTAILGNMLELGAAAEAGHEEIGRAVREFGIGRLITVGDLGAVIARAAVADGYDASLVTTCASNAEAVRMARAWLQPGDTVLVKGSRGMKMEEIAGAIKAT
ncbi:MAG: UDP-N-acetylmuramoyl-tripeptide--D-alanyl-D-alanine ligase [Bacillota bacterium]